MSYYNNSPQNPSDEATPEVTDSDTPEEKQEREHLILEMLCTSGKYYYYLAMSFVVINVIAYYVLRMHYGNLYGPYFQVKYHTGEHWLIGAFITAPSLIAFIPEFYYKNAIYYPSSRSDRLVYCLWTLLMIIAADGISWLWVGVITGHPDVAVNLMLCALPLQLIVLALPLSNRMSCYFHFCHLKRQRKRRDKGDIDWRQYK
ncbi:MAG: hypothetical protein VB081_03270 [Christensenella sp.]|uniref:hypothetical protein n=1 Tax=Christensenella sp. TaxID=1935934 RepID=UPI002B1F1475|nr:hypothetical protein [Christensenella sp.]MEA5002497.1 hypothetical protein [Christensenella sp.]